MKLASTHALANLFEIHRSKLCRAHARGLIKPVLVTPTAHFYDAADLPGLLEKLSPCLRVDEFIGAVSSLRRNGLLQNANQ